MLLVLENKAARLRAALLCALCLHGLLYGVLAWGWPHRANDKPTSAMPLAISLQLTSQPVPVSVPVPESKAPAKPVARRVPHKNPIPKMPPKLLTQPHRSVAESLTQVAPVASVVPAAKAQDTKPVSQAAEPVKAGPPAQVEAKITPAQYSPAYLNNPRPVMPLISIKNGESGVVGLRVKVSAKGEPLLVSVDKSSGFPRLDQLAAKTVKESWRFVPAKKGETPIESEVAFNIPFVLKDAE